MATQANDTMDSVLGLVKVKHSLATHEIENVIVQKIVTRIRAIPAFELLRQDPEIVLYACNLLENAYTKKVDGKKVDKKELIVRAMTLTFCLKPEEQPAVEKCIDFLWANKKIKRISLIKKIGHYTWDWCSRRLL